MRLRTVKTCGGTAQGLLQPLMTHPTEIAEGVLRFDSEQPGPTLAVIGGLHGNEPCGLAALQRLSQELENDALAFISGSIVLVHGNPEATKQYRRFTRGGVDLNRIFDFSFLDVLPRSQWSYEHHRALELRPFIDDWTAVIDLHSASFPTAPFAVWPFGEPRLPLLQRMGLEVVTRSWDGLGLPGSTALISVLSQQGRNAIAVECGQHEEPEARDRAYRYARRFLAFGGVLNEDLRPLTDTRVLQMLRVIKKPHPDYRFPRPLEGFSALQEGEDLGEGIVIEQASVAIMPNDRVEQGGDMLYLARPARGTKGGEPRRSE